jgi:hypothetical protein
MLKHDNYSDNHNFGNRYHNNPQNHGKYVKKVRNPLHFKELRAFYWNE